MLLGNRRIQIIHIIDGKCVRLFGTPDIPSGVQELEVSGDKSNVLDAETAFGPQGPDRPSEPLGQRLERGIAEVDDRP